MSWAWTVPGSLVFTAIVSGMGVAASTFLLAAFKRIRLRAWDSLAKAIAGGGLFLYILQPVYMSLAADLVGAHPLRLRAGRVTVLVAFLLRNERRSELATPEGIRQANNQDSWTA